ncbi:MAG: uroporphyrinogen-III synthase [Bdellovibrionales bacterium]
MRDLIVITRPEPDASDYALELSDAGFSVLIQPILAVRAVPVNVPDLSRYQGLLFTSAQGVRFLCHQTDRRDIAVYCVGKYTAQAAREAGFTDVHHTGGTGADLAGYVAARDGAAGRSFLHIRGRDVAFSIALSLQERGVHCDEAIVYQAVAVQDFSPDFIDALGKNRIAAVTFFSKRTAQAFMDLIAQSDSQYRLGDCLADIKALSISAPVLECVRVVPWGGVYVSKTPDRGGMLALLREIIDSQGI